MRSGAYVAGVLDALVKAGEVTPAYACGVMDTLEKRAWTGVGQFWRTNTQNANEALSDIMKDKGPGYTPTDRDYRKAMNDSRSWWNGGVGVRGHIRHWWDKNVASPVGRWLGTTQKDDTFHNNDFAAMQWKERMSAYKPDEGMNLGMAGWMQTEANKALNAAILDAKRVGMSDAEIRQRYGSSQVGQHYGSQTGNAALQSGAYKTTYEHAGPKPGATTTGAGIQAQVGTPGSHRVDGFDGMDSIWRTRRTM